MLTMAELLFRPPLAHDFSGDTLGRFHLDRRLGYGGVASIYAATCKHTGGMFALKVLHPEHHEDPDMVQRFRQEAQLAAQIRHPNLIPAYDASWLGGHLYIAMELVEGKTLTDVLADGAIGWERSAAIVCDLLAAVAALHERGVAHRDISTNNCMLEVVDGRERARLFDLDNARVLEEVAADGLTLGMPPQSVPMRIYGTPSFIAPERLLGRPATVRDDIYSIGAVWYAMLTGVPLVDPCNADPIAVAQRIKLPPALRAVLLGALELHDRRHHSAASMAAAIHAALEDIHSRPQRRRRLWAFAPLLSFLALPVYLALQPAPAEPACPMTPAPGELSTRGKEGAAPSLGPIPNSVPSAAALEPSSNDSPVPAAEDPAVDAKPSALWPLAEEPTPAPPDVRPARPPTSPTAPFSLRRALAKCKPHPTARIEIAVSPKDPVLIDGEPATGELGRCVEMVLKAHPPQHAETIKL